MSLDDFRNTFDVIAAELRTDVSRKLDALGGQLAASLEEERASQAARLAEVHAEAAAAADSARTQAEAERERMEAELATSAEAHARILAEAVEAAHARAAEEHAKALEEAVDAARMHAEQQAAERLAAAIVEAEARAHDAGLQAGRAEGREAERADRAAVERPASERLLEAIRAIDRANSLTEVLDALLAGAGFEVARVAILLVRGERLRGWRFAGFGLPLDAASELELSLADAGVIGDALRTQAAASGDSAASVPSFTSLPPGSMAVALPVSISGQVVAMVYADRGERGAADATWPATLEILTRHAARSLEVLTALRAATRIAPGRWPVQSQSATTAVLPGEAGDDEQAARRYARLLISEIKLYHEADVVAGRRERDLSTRLGGEIARARVLYERRVPPAVRQTVDYFHDELVRTLADGDAELLAHT